MQLRCTACQRNYQVDLPVMIVSCACGQLLRARPTPRTTQTPPNQSRNDAVDIDYYVVLGIFSTATAVEIKTAHRARARETHPDLGGDIEEFRLVQAAYETLIDNDRRRTYDQRDLSARTSRSWVIPDVTGQWLSPAAKNLGDLGFVFQVAAVEVPRGSPLAGMIIGQYPYPGETWDEPVVGIFLAVSQTSTIWQSIAQAVTEFGSGFATSLWSQATLSTPPARQLGSGASSARDMGQRSGEFVGEVANFGVQLLFVYVGLIFFGFFAALVIVALIFVPILGYIFGGLWLWAFYSYWKSMSKRNQAIKAHRNNHR
jgi:curved DNA-binding protein CbpA